MVYVRRGLALLAFMDKRDAAIAKGAAKKK
jgi:hypothetical protein